MQKQKSPTSHWKRSTDSGKSAQTDSKPNRLEKRLCRLSVHQWLAEIHSPKNKIPENLSLKIEFCHDEKYKSISHFCWPIWLSPPLSLLLSPVLSPLSLSLIVYKKKETEFLKRVFLGVFLYKLSVSLFLVISNCNHRLLHEILILLQRCQQSRNRQGLLRRGVQDLWGRSG